MIAFLDNWQQVHCDGPEIPGYGKLKNIMWPQLTTMACIKDQSYPKDNFLYYSFFVPV